MLTYGVLQIGSAWFFGARFDLAFQQLKAGNLRPPKSHEERSSLLAGHTAVRDEL